MSALAPPRRRALLPLAIFGLLFAFMAAALTLKPRDLPSPLVDRQLPAFSLPLLDAPGQRLSPQDLRGQVWILNVWASWCAACRLEHPVVTEAARGGLLRIYGLNYKDRPEDALEWLRKFGNPYAASLADTEGLVGIDLGVYGVPETFIIDQQGVIRHKLTGPLTDELLRDTVLPWVKKLKG